MFFCFFFLLFFFFFCFFVLFLFFIFFWGGVIVIHLLFVFCFCFNTPVQLSRSFNSSTSFNSYSLFSPSLSWLLCLSVIDYYFSIILHETKLQFSSPCGPLPLLPIYYNHASILILAINVSTFYLNQVNFS